MQKTALIMSYLYKTILYLQVIIHLDFFTRLSALIIVHLYGAFLVV